MINDIVKFSNVLRKNGIPASIRSTEMACRAVSLIGNEEINLKEALACIYLKDQRQRKNLMNHLNLSLIKKEKKKNVKIHQALGINQNILKNTM